MKIALLADVHGNLAALEAVLADMEARGPVVETIVLGDVCAFGPDPRGVLDRVSRRPLCQIVAGESERLLRSWGAEREVAPLAGLAASAVALLGTPDRVREALAWTAAAVDPRGVEWLRFLPPVYHRRLAGKTMRCAHGAPEDPARFLTSDLGGEELAALVDDVPGEVLACGGSHRQEVWEAQGRLFVSPGSVGLPLDGDRRAAYALVDMKAGAELVRVDYPWEVTQRRLREAQPPGWERIAAVLAGARPHG